MLTKTVLYATASGEVMLVEVPFSWHHGEPLPPGGLEQRFKTAEEALQELAARGRAQNRVHVPMPEKKPKKKEGEAADSAKAETDDPYSARSATAG